MNEIKELVASTRSTRRFHADKNVPKEVLTYALECARLTASGKNIQPLRYITATTKEATDALFKPLKWAANLKEWTGPAHDERPGAYIVILYDTAISDFPWVDVGIALQTILLALNEKGYAACPLASIDALSYKKICSIEERTLEPVLAIAVGKSSETVILEDAANTDTAYYRDDDDVHHVPKLTLDTVWVKAL